MSKKVVVTLTESQIVELDALSKFTGCYTRAGALRHALEEQLKKLSTNKTFGNYLVDEWKQKRAKK
ncbi:hypothetical protein ACERC8_01425 [Streptococcus sp. E29BA]|uniref:hypothetical protein n=1 Tax=Streptococcus sp. E29BA TaxID=3278716 RepID=UPI00359D788E